MDPDAVTAACAAADHSGDSLADTATAPDPTPAESEPPVATGDDPAAPAGTPPRAHCSQDAGEEQYKDPFAHTPPPAAETNNRSSLPTSSAGSLAAADPAATDGTAVAGAPQADGTASDGRPGLPNTGLDVGVLLVLGLPLLASGLALRRRLA